MNVSAPVGEKPPEDKLKEVVLDRQLIIEILKTLEGLKRVLQATLNT